MSIRLDNVSFTYLKNTSYETKALDNISLSINDGECVGIIGENGSGKSTLLDIIAGISTVDSGNVKVDGRVGVVFQFVEKQLFGSTVFEDVSFSIRDLNKEDKESRVKETLEYLGFNYEEVKDKSPFEFSLGEKRKLGIAGVIISKPDILILDEVFSGLDYDSKSSLINLLDDLNSKGTTIILISHNMDVICECTNRTIVLDKGLIKLDDSTRNVFNKLDKVSYIPLISRKLNLNCVNYSDLLEEIRKRCIHE